MTNIVQKSNFYIFTGGPGAGKTAVLDELMQRRYAGVPEVARAIIRQQHAIGGKITHDGDRLAYCNLMLKNSIDDFLQQETQNTLFFDRGIPDLYSYSKRFCNSVNLDEVNAAIRQYRYNPHVFLFPAWSEIYCHDTERKLDFFEAVETYNAVKNAYALNGYQIIDVPKVSIAKRADFILKTIESFYLNGGQLPLYTNSDNSRTRK